MILPFRLEQLSESHARTEFACGTDELDRYFQTQVTQDIRRRVTNCFVALDAASNAVAGFYTIASASIPTPDLPPELVKKLPRYPSIPAVRIGRLAIARYYQGRGLGAALLFDAARRSLAAAPAAYDFVVDAKNDQAVSFYLHHGFIAFQGHPRTLFWPLATAAKLLR